MIAFCLHSLSISSRFFLRSIPCVVSLTGGGVEGVVLCFIKNTLFDTVCRIYFRRARKQRYHRFWRLLRKVFTPHAFPRPLYSLSTLFPSGNISSSSCVSILCRNFACLTCFFCLFCCRFFLLICRYPWGSVCDESGNRCRRYSSCLGVLCSVMHRVMLSFALHRVGYLFGLLTPLCFFKISPNLVFSGCPFSYA